MFSIEENSRAIMDVLLMNSGLTGSANSYRRFAEVLIIFKKRSLIDD